MEGVRSYEAKSKRSSEGSGNTRYAGSIWHPFPCVYCDTGCDSHLAVVQLLQYGPAAGVCRTQDEVFLKNVLPNTIKYSLFVGPVGYILQFLLAWALAQIPKRARTIYALLFYSPSMTSGIAMAVIWKVIFSGDQFGYLNNVLMNMNLIEKPVQWLQNPDFLMNIMIIVTLWGSMGIGFLAILGGILNIDTEIYEAAYIDGVKNRFQEIIYVTIPCVKPQMMFGAVMSIVNTFSTGVIGVQLTGANPTPQNAGQLMINHIEDYGFLRYDMGYAAALSVLLLLMIYFCSKVVNRLFLEKEERS